MIICVDLDGTITAAPSFYKALMDGLRSGGHEVVVLSGCAGERASPEEANAKAVILDSLGLARSYDRLVVVAAPHNKVATPKVDYMTHVGACALIDNDKANVKAARKAGFLALHQKG